MESINTEWDVIKLLEEELENQMEVEKYKHQLDRLKNLAYTIQSMISTNDGNFQYVHKGTDILSKNLGELWQKVFHIEE